MLDRAREVVRKPYQKPQVSEVTLVIADVVLTTSPVTDLEDPLSLFDL